MTGGAGPADLPRSISELGKLLSSGSISTTEVTRRAGGSGQVASPFELVHHHHRRVRHDASRQH